jgi:predicted DsbA family dithiol-disulfide isomerase
MRPRNARAARLPAMQIEFVSDIACPWCAVGLHALEQALQALGEEVPVSLSFQPFELNPSMGPEGADAVAYLGAKYGIDAQQIRRNQAVIRERGAEVGFAFGERTRVWNTFDGHRLLHWAGLEGGPGAQRALKHALLQVYHGEGRNPGERQVLLDCAQAAGLDLARAAEVVDSDAFADEVRQAETFWREAGISSVPSVVVNRRHLIQGGQPPQAFEQALRRIAAQDAPPVAGA